MRSVWIVAGLVNPRMDVAQLPETCGSSAQRSTSTSASATCTTTSTLRVRAALAARGRQPRAPPKVDASTRSACLSAVIEPNTERRSERHGNREREHGRMHGDLLEPRQVGRADRDEQLEPAERKQQAEHAADRTDDEAFRRAARARCARVPAPSAARTASSCRRASARTSTRFAMLAHATSSTAPIAPMSTHSALEMLPTR